MAARRTVLVLALFVLVSCATPLPVQNTVSPLSDPPTPTLPPFDEVTLLLPELPDILNPLYARSWSARAVGDLFLAGLWKLDERLDLVPELAVEIPGEVNGGISTDGQTLTVRLRADAVWSDGWPLTADDVVFTYRMTLAEGNNLPSRFPYVPFVDEVVALNVHTVRVHFTRPFAPWPTTLFPFVLPRHILEPVFDREGSLDRAAWNRLPTVGGGPFVFVGQGEDGLLFRANSLYWRGRPEVDAVRLRAVADPAVRWDAVAAGAADLAPFLWPEVPPPLTLPSGVRLLCSPSGYVETLFFNLDPRRGHPALQGTAARLALVQAVDRERACRALVGGRTEVVQTLWGGTVFENPVLETSASSVFEAARRLDEANLQDADGDGMREWEGEPLVLRYAIPEGGPDRAAAQAVLAEMLAAAGVGTSSVALAGPWGDAAEWDMAQWAAQPAGYPDPDDPRWLCVEARPGGRNPAGVCDEELDRLLMAQAASADPDKRAALLFQVQDLARRRAWWLPLCMWQDLWAVRGAFSGLRPWRGAPFWNAWEWGLD